MKRILLLSTGGTIASKQTPCGLRPARTAEDLRTALGTPQHVQIETEDLFALDSSNITPAHWQMMARAVAARRMDYDGFIITHGTDTMAYTAAALYYMLVQIDRPVVLTGAQRPLGMAGSDAEENLRLAYRAASSGYTGVCIAFGGRLLHGNAARKIYTKADDAFRSIGRADIDLSTAAPWEAMQPFHLCDALDLRVAVVRLYPGMPLHALTAHLEAGCRGLIIEAYGCGGIPGAESQQSLLPALSMAQERGCTVVLTTQCTYDGADISLYEVGARAAALGALSGGTLPTEALYVRLMQLLADTPEGMRLTALA